MRSRRTGSRSIRALPPTSATCREEAVASTAQGVITTTRWASPRRDEVSPALHVELGDGVHDADAFT